MHQHSATLEIGGIGGDICHRPLLVNELSQIASPQDIPSPSSLAKPAQTDQKIVLFACNRAAVQKVDSSIGQAVLVQLACSM